MLSKLKGVSVSAAFISTTFWQALAQSVLSNIMTLCHFCSLQLRCIPAYDCQLLIRSNCCPGATKGVQHGHQAEPEHILDTWSAIDAPESC